MWFTYQAQKIDSWYYLKDQTLLENDKLKKLYKVYSNVSLLLPHITSVEEHWKKLFAKYIKELKEEKIVIPFISINSEIGYLKDNLTPFPKKIRSCILTSLKDTSLAKFGLINTKKLICDELSIDSEKYEVIIKILKEMLPKIAREETFYYWVKALFPIPKDKIEDILIHLKHLIKGEDFRAHDCGLIIEAVSELSLFKRQDVLLQIKDMGLLRRG